MTQPSNFERVADAMSSMQAIASAAVGYRKTLLEGGISETVADEMTQEWHTTMMDTIRQAQANAAAKAVAGAFGRGKR